MEFFEKLDKMIDKTFNLDKHIEKVLAGPVVRPTHLREDWDEKLEKSMQTPIFVKLLRKKIS